MAFSPLSIFPVTGRIQRGLVCLVMLAGVPAMAADVAFQGLGFLSDQPDALTYAYNISADGSAVVGGSSIGDSLWSFSWKEGVMTALPKTDEATIALSQAHAVSADGSVIVGMQLDVTNFTTSGYRWTSPGGIQVLPYEDGAVDNNFGTADAISSDGYVVAGSGPRAFRWTAAGGVQSLPMLAGADPVFDFSHAHGISGDGSIIVGASDSESGERAFRWTEATGTQEVVIPGASWSDATGISADGNTIVGSFSVGASATETAFAWTALGVVTMSSLSMDEGTITQVFAVSETGEWAVGTSTDRATLWDTRTGVIWDLNDIVANEPAFFGWTLKDATGISADGKKIVGNGLNASGTPEGWIIDMAIVPEPSSSALVALGISVFAFRRRKA